MREYAKKPESQSRTLDSNPKASRQAPIADILQAYLGRQPMQRESVEDEELLQATTSGQTPAGVILQRYKSNIQLYTPEEEDEELTQGKFDTAQREEIDKEKLLHGESEASAVQREEIPSSRGEGVNNTGMPDNLKNGIEALSGYSMDDVQVHYNSAKPAQLQALAYAQGTNIHIAPGQEQHLPHEAWHVVQQKQGRVQPTMQLQGVNVNDNEGLEKEADVMGGKAVQMKYINKLKKEDITQLIGADRHMAPINKDLEILPNTNDEQTYPYISPYTPPLTYHHIIPRNKLADFWNNLVDNGHLHLIRDGFHKFVIEAKERTKKYHNARLFQVGGDDIEAADVMTEFDNIAGMNQQQYAPNDTSYIIELIFQWWPANIHHGPTNRPMGGDPEEDDGGNDFEYAAKHVIKKSTFASLERINDLIDIYNRTPRLITLSVINRELKKIAGIAYITRFNKKKWYQMPNGQWKVNSRRHP